MATTHAIYSDDEAVQRFSNCLDSFFQDDAVGKMYCVNRGSDRILSMTPLAGCGAEAVAMDLKSSIVNLNRYDMIVIDSGNSSGDSWKAILYPRQRVMSFVREDF